MGLVVPGSSSSARAACPSGAGVSGVEMLPMYCGFRSGFADAVPRWEQYSLRSFWPHLRSS